MTEVVCHISGKCGNYLTNGAGKMVIHMKKDENKTYLPPYIEDQLQEYTFQKLNSKTFDRKYHRLSS